MRILFVSASSDQDHTSLASKASYTLSQDQSPLALAMATFDCQVEHLTCTIPQPWGQKIALWWQLRTLYRQQTWDVVTLTQQHANRWLMAFVRRMPCVVRLVIPKEPTESSFPSSKQDVQPEPHPSLQHMVLTPTARRLVRDAQVVLVPTDNAHLAWRNLALQQLPAREYLTYKPQASLTEQALHLLAASKMAMSLAIHTSVKSG